MKKLFISIIICTIANIIFAQTSFNNVTTITPSSLPQLNGNIYHKNNNECLLYGYDYQDFVCATSRESETVSFAIRNLAVEKYDSWDDAEFTPVFIEKQITITDNIEQNLLSALNVVKTEGIPSKYFEFDDTELCYEDEAIFDASLNTINYGKLQSSNDTTLMKNILDKGYPIIIYFQTCDAYRRAFLESTKYIWGGDIATGYNTRTTETEESYTSAVVVGYQNVYISGYVGYRNCFILYCPKATGASFEKSHIMYVPFDSIKENIFDYAIVPHSLSPYKYPTEIEGPDYLACTKTYQVPGLPPTASISWSKESFYINISAEQNSPIVTVTPIQFASPASVNAFPGIQIQMPKLIATITLNGKTIQLSKSIELASNVAPSVTIKGSLIMAYLIVGNTYTFQVTNADKFEEDNIVWDITLPNGTKQYDTGSEVKITPTSGGTLRVNIENINGCAPDNMASYSYSAISFAQMQYNNPASGTLNIQIVEQNENTRALSSETNYYSGAYTIELYDKNTTLVRKINCKENTPQIQIPISDLMPGNYYLRLIIDNQVIDVEQIIIN